MKVEYRRAIGLLAIGIFMFVYIILAASLGNLFLDKPLWIKMTYFSIAGLVWVFPLKPLFIWMRAKPNEIPAAEKPPQVSNLKKRK